MFAPRNDDDSPERASRRAGYCPSGLEHDRHAQRLGQLGDSVRLRSPYAAFTQTAYTSNSELEFVELSTLTSHPTPPWNRKEASVWRLG